MAAWRRYCLVLICLGIKWTFGEKSLVYDETQFTNPLSFEYNFDDDISNGKADYNDIYDEYIPVLPGFVVHKNGVNVGYTKLPIVTRKGPLWSTLTTEPHDIEPYRGLHTTPIPRHIEPLHRLTQQQITVEKKGTKISDIIKDVPKAVQIGSLRFGKFAHRFDTNRHPPKYTTLTTDIHPPSTKIVLIETPKRTVVEPKKFSNGIAYDFTKNAPLQSISEDATVKSFRSIFANTTPKPPTFTTQRTPKSFSTVSSKIVKKESTVSSKRVVVKPLLVSTKDAPYKGPTFGCPVLSPSRDGIPSKSTNPLCSMKEPGFSADGKCRCTYEVTLRDDRGCALNYVYTCSPRWR